MAASPARVTARKVPVNVTIDLELLQQLDTLVAQMGLTRSQFIRELIEDYLTDTELAKVAEQRMEDSKAGRAATVSLDEVKRELGL